MKKILGFYNKFEEYLLVGSLVVTVFIIFIQIIARYVFNSSLSWSEELARYIFIWQIWLGASLGVRERKHIRIEIIFDIFKGKRKQYVDGLATLIWIALCIFLTVSGTQLTLNLFRLHSLSAALRIPIYFIYATLPVSCLAMSLRLIGQLAGMFKGLSKEEGGKA